MQPDPALEGNKVSGYRLYAAHEQSNVFSLVYDGAGYPQIRSAIHQGLTTGDRYDYKVEAINFNGAGARSPAMATRSCLRPSGVSAPKRVAGSSTAARDAFHASQPEVTLSWSEPAATGGCPITGYALFRNDPDLSDPATGSETWAEITTSSDGAAIREKPELFQATIAGFAAGSVGKEFKYYVEAFNTLSTLSNGGTSGTTASFILATRPAAPAAAPQIPTETRSSTSITVLLPALSGNSETGGAEISSYALQQSTSARGEPANFVDVAGVLGDSLAL